MKNSSLHTKFTWDFPIQIQLQSLNNSLFFQNGIHNTIISMAFRPLEIRGLPIINNVRSFRNLSDGHKFIHVFQRKLHFGIRTDKLHPSIRFYLHILSDWPHFIHIWDMGMLRFTQKFKFQFEHFFHTKFCSFRYSFSGRCDD